MKSLKFNIIPRIIGSALGGFGVISIALLSLGANTQAKTERATDADSWDVKFTPAVAATTNHELNEFDELKLNKMGFWGYIINGG